MDGTMHVFINGEDMGVAAAHVPKVCIYFTSIRFRNQLQVPTKCVKDWVIVKKKNLNIIIVIPTYVFGFALQKCAIIQLPFLQF